MPGVERVEYELDGGGVIEHSEMADGVAGQ
jgi:hypothetical protein